MEYFFRKAMEVQEMGKVIQLSVVFYILSKGHPMIEYPSLNSLLHFAKVHYYARSHWLIKNGWEWESYLA